MCNVVEVQEVLGVKIAVGLLWAQDASKAMIYQTHKTKGAISIRQKRYNQRQARSIEYVKQVNPKTPPGRQGRCKETNKANSKP